MQFTVIITTARGREYRPVVLADSDAEAESQLRDKNNWYRFHCGEVVTRLNPAHVESLAFYPEGYAPGHTMTQVTQFDDNEIFIGPSDGW